MFKRDKKLDVEGINEIIFTTNKILKIGLVAIFISLIVLILSVCKSLNLFSFISEFFIVISPVFIGIIIAWLFDPIVNYLTSKKIPRVVACIIVYLIFIGGIILLLFLLVPSFIDQIKDFVGAIPDILSSFKDFISNMVNKFSHNTDLDLTDMKKNIFSSIEKTGTSLTTSLPNTLLAIVKSLVSGGLFVVLGLMVGFYMLYDFNKVQKGIIKIMPRSWRENAKDLMSRINQSLRGYVIGVLTIMLLVFITQSISLTIIGLKAPLVFALFCAITDIIPYFGPYIGAIPAVLVGFSMSPFTGICTIIVIVIVQLLENNFYQPLIMGHAMKLHPVTIMIGLLIFEHFFGIIGMVVATPAIATLKVIFTFIDEKINVVEKIKGEKISNEEG